MPSESLFVNCRNCNNSVHKSAKRCPNCGEKVNRYKLIKTIAALFIILFAIGKFSAHKPPESTRSTVKQGLLEQNIQLEYSWGKSGFGSVMLVDFIITNHNDINIKDIEIECRHFAKSGTQIDRNTRTIYEVIEHGSTKEYPDFNMGLIHSQTNKSSCFVKQVSDVN